MFAFAKTLSFWARDHRIAAQFLIALLQLVQVSLAILIGIVLSAFGWEGAVEALIICFLVILFTVYQYPPDAGVRYLKARLIYGVILQFAILASLATLTALSVSAEPPSIFQTGLESKSLDYQMSVVGPSVNTVEIDRSMVKFRLRHFIKARKEIRNVLRLAHDSPENGKPVHIIWHLLALLGVTALLLGVGFAIAAIACSISCNGSSALIIALLVLSIVALCLLVWLFVGIMNKRDRKVRRYQEIQREVL